METVPLLEASPPDQWSLGHTTATVDHSRNMANSSGGSSTDRGEDSGKTGCCTPCTRWGREFQSLLWRSAVDTYRNMFELGIRFFTSM